MLTPPMDLRGYSAFLLAGILFIFPACSVFKPAPTIRPALAASGCKPPIVAQNNQAGMALYNERRFEDVIGTNIVCDIHDLNVRRNAQNHAFHDSDERVAKPEVCRERYNVWHAARLFR